MDFEKVIKNLVEVAKMILEVTLEVDHPLFLVKWFSSPKFEE